MNKHQRNSNRENYQELHKKFKEIQNSKHICENCGLPGGHWYQLPQNLYDIIQGKAPEGFYSCYNKSKGENYGLHQNLA